MNDTPFFLKREGLSVYVKEGYEVTFYIPESLFNNGCCSIEGLKVSLLGIFNYTVSKDGNVIKGLRLFNFPTIFESEPTDIINKKNVKLTKYQDVDDYKLLVFREGSKVIINTKVQQSVGNVEKFFKAFEYGKVPNSIPNNQIYLTLKNTMLLNGNKFDVNDQTLGIFQTEPTRGIKDKSKPFRLSGSNDQLAYVFVGSREIPKLISPFTSLTSENWDESAINAIINKNHQESPLERLFMD